MNIRYLHFDVTCLINSVYIAIYLTISHDISPLILLPGCPYLHKISHNISQYISTLMSPVYISRYTYLKRYLLKYIMRYICTFMSPVYVSTSFQTLLRVNIHLPLTGKVDFTFESNPKSRTYLRNRFHYHATPAKNVN